VTSRAVPTRATGWARMCPTCELVGVVVVPAEHCPAGFLDRQPPAPPDVKWRCAGCGGWVHLVPEPKGRPWWARVT
jgi:hypothetical protein